MAPWDGVGSSVAVARSACIPATVVFHSSNSENDLFGPNLAETNKGEDDSNSIKARRKRQVPKYGVGGS